MISFNPKNNNQVEMYYSPHFTDENIEARGGSLTYLKWYISWERWGPQPEASYSRYLCFELLPNTGWWFSSSGCRLEAAWLTWLYLYSCKSNDTNKPPQWQSLGSRTFLLVDSGVGVFTQPHWGHSPGCEMAPCQQDRQQKPSSMQTLFSNRRSPDKIQMPTYICMSAKQ